jgi:type IX secretion system PorP/SprF family membrane protein
VGFILCILSLSQSVFAQQMPHYSLFERNLYAFNPAYGGMDFKLNLTGIYRSQWNELSGTPERYHLNGHMPLFAAGGGAGFVLKTEQIGPRRVTEVSLSYNYVLSSDYGIFSFGLRPTMRSWSWDGSQLTTPDGTYEDGAINHEDPILSSAALGATQFNFDLGVHFQGFDLKAGLFISQLLPSRAQLTDNFYYTAQVEWGLYGIYDYEWRQNISLNPALVIVSDGSRTQSTAKIGALFNKKYYLATGLRGYSGTTIDAFILGAGIQLDKNFWMYYNYDIGLSALRNAHSGSQEIIITYSFLGNIGGIVPPRVIYNPRYM